MNNDSIGFARPLQFVGLTLALFTILGGAYALPLPQATSSSQSAAATTEKRPLTVDDYASWRNISGQQISGDGKWVSYVLQFANTAEDEEKPVLHLLNLETGVEVEIPDATGGMFSKDSRWIAYQINAGNGGGGGRRGGRSSSGSAQSSDESETKQATRRTELRDLSTNDVRSWQDIQSFAFSADSTHMILRRSPRGTQTLVVIEGQGRGSGDNSLEIPGGIDVVVHDLATRRDQLLGSVGEIFFNKNGDLLAYTVDAAVKDSNGLFVLDLDDSRMHALDNDTKSYNELTWNEDGTALAVLKGLEVDEMRERSNVLIAFPDVRAALGGGGEASSAQSVPTDPVVFDPTTADNFPEGWVVSDRASLNWSNDNARIFFGTKTQVAVPSIDARGRGEAADVDIWNTLDERIQSLQMRRVRADRNFTFRQAFDVTTGKFIKLADDTMRDIEIASQGRWAVGRDARGYIDDYSPSAADIYRVDTTTGERTLMLERQLVGSHVFGISKDGRYFLYWQDEKIRSYDLEAGTSHILGGNNAVSFTNMEFDRPGPKPSYGIAGYTADGTAAIVQHRYDLWVVPFDGSDSRNLTNGLGSDNEIRFRYVNTLPDDQPGGGGRGGGGRREIDLSKPITLSAYGQWTKKAGFYELADGKLREIVYEDASFSTPTRASESEKFLLTRQTFVEFPDLRVSSLDFNDSTKITNANPQQAEYNWGRRVLFDFENKDGVRLQGILALPDDYQEGEKRPMIVTFYEKNSQNLHRYSAPRYLTGMGASPIQAVSEGYITMLPDIHFRTGASHSDMLECVEAAVQKVIEMGYVDPERIAVTGHSYGGEGAAFIGVRSDMFAAVGMGAGVTDLYSDFNQNWGWTYDIDGGSGNNGHGYYLFGQGREAVTPWENPELYRFESAITHAPDAKQPFLIMHGTDDPTVAFQNGLGFYNALRLNGKTAIMLAYPGEGHGLRRMPNRRDLTIRYFEFFNHYLKDAPAPEWMTEGVSFLDKVGR